MKFKDFLQESTEKHAVLAFGRMNPPTTGHEVLVNKVHEVARQNKASHHIVLSHSQDKAKNPLTADQKLKHARRFFPGANLSVATKEDPNFLKQAEKLHKSGVTHLHMVAGSDRVSEYHKLLHKYNGTHQGALFNFKNIKVHSAGERDPDAEGTTGMSASKMRSHAMKGNYKEFKKGIPAHVKETHAKELYDHVRKGMQINESLDEEFILLEGVHDKGIFKAVFLGGGPGSGKDYVLSNTLDGHGLVEINSDNALEYLMDKEKLDKKMPENEEEQRNDVRKRAKNITELRQRLALNGRNGVIINGTGDDPEKTARIKELLEKLGYDTKMVMVNTRDEVSQARNVERGQRGGRTVPENIRKQKWDDVQAARTEYAKLFGPNYHEFDNSEDLRTASEEVKQQKQKEMMDIFKAVKEFVDTPPESDQSREWIAKEMQKKDTAPLPKSGEEKSPSSESNAASEAEKLGLQYYGFGRYGQQGKVTHRSVHDRLVDIRTKTVNEEFDTFLNESVTFTVTADTPEEAAKFMKLLKDDEPEEVEEDTQYELSNSSARDALTLGKEINESKDQDDYLKDHNDNLRKFYIRNSAAKEAHRNNGEVEKKTNYYVVKLRRKINEEVSNNDQKYVLAETTSLSSGERGYYSRKEVTNTTTKKITGEEIRNRKEKSLHEETEDKINSVKKTFDSFRKSVK